MRLNYCKKSLDALSGGDDKIFVILDDRDDVWLQDDGSQSQNLFKIPAYFYFHDRNPMYTNAGWFEKSIRSCGQSFDLDLTLLIFGQHLKKIHNKFFASDLEELKDSKFHLRKLRREVFSYEHRVSF